MRRMSPVDLANYIEEAEDIDYRIGELPTVAAVTVGRMEDNVVWHVQVVVDADGHLNIYIENEDGTEIEEVETTQGDGESLALRFTTHGIEKRYLASEDP